MQRMFKKGDLSMSTIVMAVIAVLIMVILVSLVTRTLGDTGEVVRSCVDNSGRCSYDSCSEEEFPGYRISASTYQCAGADGRVDNEQQCCVRG